MAPSDWSAEARHPRSRWVSLCPRWLADWRPCWRPRRGCCGCCRCCRPDRDWSGAELAERLGVSPRTVRRDVERLRELGYPVHATRGVAGGYRLGAGRRPAAAAARRRGGRGGRGRAAHGAPAARRGHRGDLGARAGQAGAGAAVPAAAPGQRAAGVHRAGAPRWPRPGGRPGRADRAGRRLPRPRAAALRLPRTTTGTVSRARRRAVPAGHLGPPLVPGRPGTSTGRTGGPSGSTGSGHATPTGPRFTPRELPEGGDLAAYVSRRRVGRRLALPRAGPGARAGRGGRPSGSPPAAGMVETIDERTCLLHTGADTLETLAVYLGMLGADFEVSRAARARRAPPRPGRPLPPGHHLTGSWMLGR